MTNEVREGGDAPVADLRTTVQVGLWTCVAALVLAVAFLVLPGHGRIEEEPTAALITVGVATVVLLAPWRRRLFVGARGQRLVYAWSLADIALVSAGIAVTGGERSPLFLFYALTSLFVTSGYPRRAQVVALVMTLVAYLATLAVAGGPLEPATVVLRVGVIGVLTALGASIANDKDRNAADAARRAVLLETVASAAREVSGAPRAEILGAVLRAAARLGFEYGHVSVLDEGEGRIQVLQARGMPLEALEQGLERGGGLFELVRRARSTVWVADYASDVAPTPEFVKVGLTVAVGSPIFLDGALVGVLAVGTRQRRAVSPEDREAFELLAGVASRAFEGARRFEELAEREAQMRHMALHDELTGLANRNLFSERLEEALAAVGGRGVGCMVFDLDDFKRVNDTLGHAAGDELLTGVARRISGCLRPIDTVARLSGDEFGIVIAGLGPDELRALAGRILAAVAAPLRVAGHEVRTRASIGVATAPSAPSAPSAPAAPAARIAADRLLSEADAAMYEAKHTGKGRHLLYDEAMRTRMGSRLALEAELVRALERGEMSVVYQPIFDLPTEALVGFEALARWESASLGPVPPSEFIPVAEALGSIGEIGRFVLREACEALQGLRRANAAWSDLAMHVNLSTRQLADPGLVEDVLVALAETWTPSWCLTLEITESALLDDAALCEQRLEALAALGISVALDDFGTGYSSLAYLRQLKVHSLKIDKSFVEALGEGTAGPALVASIVNLADALSLTTVAEGVETERQRALLRELGCTRAQGYLLSRPIPAARLADYVAGRRVLGHAGPTRPTERATGGPVG